MEFISEVVSNVIMLTMDIGSTVAFMTGRIANNAKRGYNGYYVPIYSSDIFREIASDVQENIRQKDQPSLKDSTSTVGFC